MTLENEKWERYLNPGLQTTLSEENIRVVEKTVNHDGGLLKLINDVFNWKARNIKNKPTDVYIGTRTIGKILKEKDEVGLTGCHDHGIVVASILRHFGYPVIFIQTTEAVWVKEFIKGKTTGFHGHVMLEILYEGKWILFDSTRGLIELNYRPDDPVIEAYGHKYYTIMKGLDPMDNGGSTIEGMRARMAVVTQGVDFKSLPSNPHFPIHISELVKKEH